MLYIIIMKCYCCGYIFPKRYFFKAVFYEKTDAEKYVRDTDLSIFEFECSEDFFKPIHTLEDKYE